MNILFILEGDEEKALFDVFDDYINKRNFNITYKNVRGFGLVAPTFQSSIADSYYDVVMCVYDVDNKANINNSPYNSVRNNLKNVLGNYKKADDISICTNPNIMQIFLLACDCLDNVKMNKTSKTENTDLIHRYWPEIGNKKVYDASGWQLDKIKESFQYGKYDIKNIFVNGENLSENYLNLPGSNIISLLKALTEGNTNYFNKAIKVKEDKKH